MICQTEVGLLSGKGPLIATFGYEKSDTRLYHFYRSNMSFNNPNNTKLNREIFL